MPDNSTAAVTEFLHPFPPKAAPLIVTIYGDVVEPRGGTLWMGDLITLCGSFGINESLVRTAVSRLVSRDQLVGHRDGRKSYYELTQSAKSSFQDAGKLFFGPPDDDCDLVLVFQTDASEKQALLAQGFCAAGGDFLIGTDRSGVPAKGAVFQSVANCGKKHDTEAFLSTVFGLSDIELAYRLFVERFEKIDVAKLPALKNADALACRIALVHAYREIRLKDPRLPSSVLPKNWSGQTARDLFAKLYIALSEEADIHAGRALQGRDGLLEACPQPVTERLTGLKSSI